MSGTSRIGGSGGYAGTTGGQSRSGSLARFCHGRKRGDVVSGIFLRMETDDLGWALLEDEELLAHLPENRAKGSIRPLPGDHIFFRIDALAPEVVLHMLSAADPLVRIAALLPSRPMAQEAALYTAARDAVDALLARCLGMEPGLFAAPTSAARKEAFIDCLASNAALLEGFTETLARSRALSRAAASSGLLFFQYMPWLCGGLAQIEVSLWRGGESPVFAGARLPSGDRLLLRGTMENGRLRHSLSIVGINGRSARKAAVAYPDNEAQTAVGEPERSVDLVSHILALAADSDASSVGRFSRKL